MSTGTDISALYREFADALTEVLAETAGNPAFDSPREKSKRHPFGALGGSVVPCQRSHQQARSGRYAMLEQSLRNLMW